MLASQRKAMAVRARVSKSLASLRQRPSQAKVRSTIQRLGRTLKPAASARLTISICQSAIAASAVATRGPW